MSPSVPELPPDIASAVRRALSEDVGTGDLSADLLPAEAHGVAFILCREAAVLCGCAWFEEVFRQLDPAVRVQWFLSDGAAVAANTKVCDLRGPTRALLTGERAALNFLQLLSGTATTTRDYAQRLAGTGATLLDTRKTVPGLRAAQKYAVLCGGGTNHRMGLYDAILLKENHIHAAGGVTAAVRLALASRRQVQVEVETLEQLEEAIDAGAHGVLLDNFTLPLLRAAVAQNRGRLKLEASGGMGAENLRAVAETGVDFISVGALTKHVRAIDYSMRFAHAP